MESLQEKLSRIIEPERISTSGEYLDELSWDALSQSRFHPRHQPSLAAPLLAVAPVSTEETALSLTLVPPFGMSVEEAS